MTPLIAAAVGILIAGCLLMGIVKLFACTHAWEFVDKTDFPPPMETAKKNGVDISWDLTSYQITHMSKRTVVIVLRCPKCGDAKILRETH